uniref:Uncharacterized protein n=1 Tax=Micrurus spixii TaxID=129469 RepID=A0A2D4NIL0_9SAUR
MYLGGGTVKAAKQPPQIILYRAVSRKLEGEKGKLQGCLNQTRGSRSGSFFLQEVGLSPLSIRGKFKLAVCPGKANKHLAGSEFFFLFSFWLSHFACAFHWKCLLSNQWLNLEDKLDWKVPGTAKGDVSSLLPWSVCDSTKQS